LFQRAPFQIDIEMLLHYRLPSALGSDVQNHCR
jgi:hypothetical protein